jgi:predicted secreted protein
MGGEKKIGEVAKQDLMPTTQVIPRAREGDMNKQTRLVLVVVFAGLAATAVSVVAASGAPGGILASGTGVQIVGPHHESTGKELGKLVSYQENPGKESLSDRFEVAVGQEFTITLASNATTGYHWELTAPPDETVVKLVTNAYKSPETRALGAGGQEIWTFRAMGPGQTVINLKYVRPWEKDVAPVKTASYVVNVW